MDKFDNTIKNAAKWSTMTEICRKLIVPITNMILARLLAPEQFGIVATVTMIFSFADIFSDAGFQIYLIQNDFKSDVEKYNYANVAFWTNLIISMLIWIVIIIFNEDLAALTGDSGLGHVFIVACLSLPLTALSSIQLALYRRDFDFKTLFFVRISQAIVPFFVTIPLAYLTRNFWALIIGTIAGNLSNALILTIKSKWKPTLFFSFIYLYEMFSYGMWVLIENFTDWLTKYIGIFIVGIYLSNYYLGIYNITIITVNQIMAIIVAATTPVLFASLSRKKNDKEEFKRVMFNFQRNVALWVIPMGVGLLIFRDFVTKILLGSQWAEAANFIGLWSLVMVFKILLSDYCTQAFRALGQPKTAVFAKITQVLILIPLLSWGAQKSFSTLYLLRSLAVFELIFINVLLIRKSINISILEMLKNFTPFLICSLIMGISAYLLRSISDMFVWDLISIIICILIYFGSLMIIFPQYKIVILKLIKSLRKRIC